MTFRVYRSSAAAIVAAAFVLSGPAFAADRPDAWITTKAKIALLTTEGVSGMAIHVDTTDGRVTLHGTVATENERKIAAETIRGIDGVRDVRDLVQVVPMDAGASVKTSDAVLKKRVAAALDEDAALGDSSIRVKSVNSGLVLLAGRANSLSDHLRALEDAAAVPGAVRIESNIKSPDELADAEVWQNGSYDPAASAGSTARDVWVTSAVKMLLIANSETPALNINVDTNNGVVTLFGTVPSEKVKRSAAIEVRKVGGVKTVNNELQIVAPDETKNVARTDSAVKSAVEKRLGERGALADASIDVEVSNGVARLKGEVQSQQDRITALTVTSGTSGVRAVLDELRLELPAVSAR